MAKIDAVSLYVHDGASAQTGVTAQTKLTQFTAAIDPDAGDGSVVPDVANDEIDVNGGGVYKVDVALSLEASAATVVQAHVAAGGTEIAHLAAECDIATGEVDDAHALAISGLYAPAAPGTTVVLSVVVESSNSANILVEHGQFTVMRID